MIVPRPHPYLVWYHYKTLFDLNNMVSLRSSILDLGCGEGLLLRKTKAGNIICGLDLSKRSLKQSKDITPDKFLVLADATHLPFRDGVFHVVISHQLIEHIEDKSKMISEISRILKQNGSFIVTTPVKGFLGNIFARSRNEAGEKVLSPDHIREYKSERELIRSVTDASGHSLELKQQEKRSVQFPLARLFPWFYNRNFLGPIIPLCFYYYDIYSVFQKVNKLDKRKY